jgi:hypothetical protein
MCVFYEKVAKFYEPFSWNSYLWSVKHEFSLTNPEDDIYGKDTDSGFALGIIK